MRPTGYPGWASGAGATNITEPTAGQKASGWETNQIPPSGYQNWLDSLTYGWIKHLNESLLEQGIGVKDDFQGAQFDVAKWIITGSGGMTLINDATGGAFGAVRMISHDSLGSVPRFITNEYEFGTAHDFRLEARVKTPHWRPTGMSHVGQMRAQVAGTYGVGFIIQGNSGPWWVTAAGPAGTTSFSASLYPSPSYYDRMIVEHRKGMAYLSIVHPTGVAYSVSVPFVPTGRAAPFFAQFYGFSGEPTLHCVLDYLSFSAETSR